MTDAPDRIALRWEPGAAVTSGPLMTHHDYTRYVREDATFTADDLRRAFAIALEIAAEQMQAWANGVDASDYPQAAKVIPTLVDTTIRVFANMPPPDDLPARVKEGAAAMSDKLVADLREESRLSQRTAWEQADGGQDYCIAAQLADAAADRIEMQATRIAELEAENARLRGLLQECADDLRSYVDNEYPETMRAQYPSMQRRWTRDMELVFRVRAALAADSGAAE